MQVNKNRSIKQLNWIIPRGEISHMLNQIDGMTGGQCPRLFDTLNRRIHSGDFKPLVRKPNTISSLSITRNKYICAFGQQFHHFCQKLIG